MTVDRGMPVETAIKHRVHLMWFSPFPGAVYEVLKVVGVFPMNASQGNIGEMGEVDCAEDIVHVSGAL